MPKLRISLGPDVALDQSRPLDWRVVPACKAERDGQRCTLPDNGHTGHMAGWDALTMWDDG